MAETRTPRRSQGVPKETPARYRITDLQAILSQIVQDVAWEMRPLELNRRSFLAAGMQQQVGIMAEAPLSLLGPACDSDALLAALAASPVETVRGIAAAAVPLLHAGDIHGQLQRLRFTGALERAPDRARSRQPCCTVSSFSTA